MSAASAAANEYRLETRDEEQITKRIAETVADWKSRAWPQPFRPTSYNTDALTRIAAHSIGCSLYDLRESELDWIAARVTDALKETTP